MFPRFFVECGNSPRIPNGRSLLYLRLLSLLYIIAIKLIFLYLFIIHHTVQISVYLYLSMCTNKIHQTDISPQFSTKLNENMIKYLFDRLRWRVWYMKFPGICRVNYRGLFEFLSPVRGIGPIPEVVQYRANPWQKGSKPPHSASSQKSDNLNVPNRGRIRD